MSNLERHVLDILINAPTLRDASTRIARVIETSMKMARDAHEENYAKLDQSHHLFTRFYAYEGRTTGLIEAVALLDKGLKRRELREALADRARKYHGQMAHYHVMLKVMQ